MARLRVRGPVRLRGEVAVRGAKNASLPILIASAVSPDSVSLTNVPTDLVDVRVILDAIRYLGRDLEVSDGRVELRAGRIRETTLPAELAGKVRYSLLFLGLLAGLEGRARLPMPGGCALGDRRFDLHLDGLRRLGARVEESETGLEVWAEKLIGADIEFYLPTTSGTENVLIAACFAEGRTRIFNANTRPEIVDLGRFLNSIGGNVTVRNRVVEVIGPANFHSGAHAIMSGWDEALTYVIAAGVTGGEICVRDFSLEHVQQDVVHLRSAGLDVFEWGGNVYASGREKRLRAFDLFTGPYPGVNSDMQPIFAVLGSQCRGETSITDQRFTERFQYVRELQRMGVEIESYGNSAIIRGPSRLHGEQVRALDLRCGAALMLAALAAEGETVIENHAQIARGYERVDERLSALGATISLEAD